MLNIEKLLYRIILNYYYIYLNNQTYKIISCPSWNVRYESEILYDKIIEENKYNQIWLTPEQIELYLLDNNIWNQNYENILKRLDTDIEDLKIDIYKNFYNTKSKEKFKKKLKTLYKQQNDLKNKKDCMNYLGIKDYALSIKNEFIIRYSIYNMNNTLVFDPTMDDYNHSQLQGFVREIIDNSINPNDMRALARSDFFRGYASSSNLEKSLIDMTEEYKYLVNLYKMYDNARQHPESPDEDIINDDDALDGWFLYQQRKAKKEIGRAHV